MTCIYCGKSKAHSFYTEKYCSKACYFQHKRKIREEARARLPAGFREQDDRAVGQGKMGAH
jgi:hypothetical protein